jgi:hypothetical protein
MTDGESGYMLNEEQALFMALQADTPTGKEICLEVVGIVMAYRRGEPMPRMAKIDQFLSIFHPEPATKPKLVWSNPDDDPGPSAA